MALLVDEHLATGADPGPGHDVLSGRYACYGVYATRDQKWLAVGAIEAAFWANLCRALGLERWIAHQYDDAQQDADPRRPRPPRFRTRDRDAWVARAGARGHLRGARALGVRAAAASAVRRRAA